MPLEIVTVAALDDNYDFLLHDSETGRVACIDVADAAPILDALSERGWTLDEIWLTHHHWDHIDGAEALQEATGATITGAKADAHRLPKLDRIVENGDSFDFAGHAVQVMDVYGHTIGHVAFYVPDANAAFTADSLMALGCGRLFEGTPAQMFDALTRLAALPDDTVICSGHEYTTGNLKFALTIDPDNAALQERGKRIAAARADGKFTVPSLLSEEKATNPFLRAADPAVRATLGMEDAADVDVFTEIRRRKDNF